MIATENAYRGKLLCNKGLPGHFACTQQVHAWLDQQEKENHGELFEINRYTIVAV